MKKYAGPSPITGATTCGGGAESLLRLPHEGGENIRKIKNQHLPFVFTNGPKRQNTAVLIRTTVFCY